MREKADLSNVLHFNQGIKRSNSKSDLNRETLERVDREANNRSINEISSRVNKSILNDRKESNMPNYKNRLKQSKLIESYVISESPKMTRKRITGANGALTIKNPRDNSLTKSDELNDEYGQYESIQETQRLSKRRRQIDISKRINEEFVSDINQKYHTPSNFRKIPSLERQSDATTNVTQMNSMRKISQSIDKIRMQKRINKNHPLSLPTDIKDLRSNLNATGRFSKVDFPTTPKLPVKNTINELSTSLEGAFVYSKREIELLTKHPLILRRINNWDEELTSEYLINLKKKQRQIGKF